MEQYFQDISRQPGHEEFEKESWCFKVLFRHCLRPQADHRQHDRLNVERRIAENATASTGLGATKTSDIARLMELFQVRFFYFPLIQ
jgi:hypothetical protein